jgi:phosphoglycolate phosphatase-like HAD superfamily hydrolase
MDTANKEQQMIKRIAIYDMDGTIVDSSHRYRTVLTDAGERIDIGYWRENQHLAMLDELLPLINQYWSDLADPECYTIIATARVMNEPDWLFARTMLEMPDYFISRSGDSSQSGSLLKINGLVKCFKEANIDLAKMDDVVFYEDNVQYLKAVCDYFNIRGVYIPSKQGH